MPAPYAAQIAGPTDDPETQLRLAVDRRLQEHVLLLALALRPGVPPNVDAPNAPLDELAQLIAPIYGEPMANGLASVLHEHTTALLTTNRPAAPAALDAARVDLDATLATRPPPTATPAACWLRRRRVRLSCRGARRR